MCSIYGEWLFLVYLVRFCSSHSLFKIVVKESHRMSHELENMINGDLNVNLAS